MKSERGIFIAFILNLFFSFFEVVGGIVTGSVAIISDAVHDFGDAAAIGIAFFLERKSKRQPDESHTFGYGRYSLLGGLMVTLILIFGSVTVTVNAVSRIFNPTEIDYNSMIVFALVGAVVNIVAARFTHQSHSANSRAVSLHLLEDVLGWVVVLIGAVAMRFTDFYLIDPIMSIGVSVFILISAFKNLKEVLDIFLEKTPEEINPEQLKSQLEELEGVFEVHHLHLRRFDSDTLHATLHVVVEGDFSSVKSAVRHELENHGISHVTIETESKDEHCTQRHCHVKEHEHKGYCHGDCL